MGPRHSTLPAVTADSALSVVGVWSNQQGPKLASGAALAGIVMVVAVAWRKGYFRRKRDEGAPAL